MTSDLQLALPGQKRLLNEWLVHAGQASPPAREAMQPAQFLSELGYISILQLQDDTIRFRLVGSSVRRYIQQDPRGHTLCDFPDIHDRVCGHESIMGALEGGKPTSGMDIFPQERVHFWLRLPVIDPQGHLTQVICHDRLLPADLLDDDHPEIARWCREQSRKAA